MTIKAIEGLPVIDAKQPVTLIVTNADVARSDRKKAGNCAAAQACYRQLHVDARVHLSRVYLKHRGGKTWTRLQTPTNLRQEIITFDRGGTFAPGAYTLTPVRKGQELTGRRRGGNKPHPRNPHDKKRTYRVVSDVRSGPA